MTCCYSCIRTPGHRRRKLSKSLESEACLPINSILVPAPRYVHPCRSWAGEGGDRSSGLTFTAKARRTREASKRRKARCIKYARLQGAEAPRTLPALGPRPKRQAFTSVYRFCKVAGRSLLLAGAQTHLCKCKESTKYKIPARFLPVTRLETEMRTLHAPLFK